MTSWTFDSDMEGWTNLIGGVFTWNAAGYSGGGVKGNNVQDGRGIQIDIASTPVITGDPLSFRCRVIGEGDIEDDVRMTMVTSGGSCEHTFPSDGVVDYDSGWVLISGTMITDTDVDHIDIEVHGFSINVADVYIDDVFFLETEADAGYTHSSGGIPGAII